MTETANEYAFPPAAASSEEDILEPNSLEREGAVSGPDEQISQTAYVEMTKPDGMTFLSPLANVEHYEAKGYTAGAEQDIPDLVLYLAEQGGQPNPYGPRPAIRPEAAAGETPPFGQQPAPESEPAP